MNAKINMFILKTQGHRRGDETGTAESEGPGSVPENRSPSVHLGFNKHELAPQQPLHRVLGLLDKQNVVPGSPGGVTDK